MRSRLRRGAGGARVYTCANDGERGSEARGMTASKASTHGRVREQPSHSPNSAHPQLAAEPAAVA
jgi:hypothetical protein